MKKLTASAEQGILSTAHREENESADPQGALLEQALHKLLQVPPAAGDFAAFCPTEAHMHIGAYSQVFCKPLIQPPRSFC